MPVKSKVKKELAKEFSLDGKIYKAGDCLMIEGDEERPFIGRFQYCLEDKEDLVMVTWFYWPEDSLVPGGRRPWNGKQELYKSEHDDPIPKLSIIRRCFVHTLEDWEALEECGPYDFFTRWFFKHTEEKMAEQDVRLLCICNQPYNPDRHMIQCCGCNDWFHYECMGLDPNMWPPKEPFSCRQTDCPSRKP